VDRTTKGGMEAPPYFHERIKGGDGGNKGQNGSAGLDRRAGMAEESTLQMINKDPYIWKRNQIRETISMLRTLLFKRTYEKTA